MGKSRMLLLLACAFALTMIVACETGLGSVSPLEAQAENSEDHADPQDYVWDSSDVTPIVLNGTSITVEGDGAAVDGGNVIITSAGSYSISGSLTDGQILVDTEDEDLVRLILNGVSLANSISAPIYIKNAEETIIILGDNTENYVSDGAAYIFENAAENEPNAAIFSNGNLTIYGAGALTVVGNYNDGISSDDGLVIASGTVTVSAADDGIRGKDYLVIEDGTITVNAQGDGLKSDNEDDAAKGDVTIVAGTIQVAATGDAIQAQTDVLIADGNFVLSSGGGSSVRIDESTSTKGIKAVVSLQIDGGTFTIDSADDAIHSNASVAINGGTFVITTGDDGIHADSTLTIDGGDIRISDSYEGIESAVITINAGNLRIVSSDDGINVAGGNDGSGMNGRPGRGGQSAFATSTNYYLYINGGYIVVDAAGDGIDVNGAIEMTDGTVIVNGPTEQMNGAIDYDVSFNISGGFLVAAGSSGMAQAPGQTSTQASLLLNFGSTQLAGSLVHIQAADGVEILTFSPTKDYQSVAFSSPELRTGVTYEVYSGGSSNGTVVDGVYQDGSYSPGTQYTSFTISDPVTLIGSVARFR